MNPFSRKHEKTQVASYNLAFRKESINFLFFNEFNLKWTYFLKSITCLSNLWADKVVYQQFSWQSEHNKQMTRQQPLLHNLLMEPVVSNHQICPSIREETDSLSILQLDGCTRWFFEFKSLHGWLFGQMQQINKRIHK